MEVNMVYGIKSDKVAKEVTIKDLKEKLMQKVDSLLDMSRISPADLKIVSDIVKDLDMDKEERLMSFCDTMLKGISDTSKTLEERYFSSPLPTETSVMVKKPVKEKKDE